MSSRGFFVQYKLIRSVCLCFSWFLQVYILHSIFAPICSNGLELSVLLAALHLCTDNSCRGARQELEPQNIVKPSTFIWVWPTGRSLQPNPLLGNYAGHALAKLSIVLCALLCVQWNGDWSLWSRLSVGDSGSSVGQRTPSHGCSPLELAPPCGSLGFSDHHVPLSGCNGLDLVGWSLASLLVCSCHPV